MQGRFGHLTPEQIKIIQDHVDEEWAILRAKVGAPREGGNGEKGKRRKGMKMRGTRKKELSAS